MKITSSFVFFLLVLGLTSCGKHEKPNFEYMPNMVYSPSNKAQESQDLLKQPGMREPVKGTIPRGFEAYPYPDSPEKAGLRLKNPLKRTRAVLDRGKEVYNIYCIVCHGKYGEGDGYIVPKFSRPPTLQSDKVKNWSDGRLYHIVTMGQNIMPSYASQVKPDDRWAVVHFLRVLYRAKHPSNSDLEKAKDW